MRGAYERDLAYIHHAGFGDFAERAAPRLLALFRKSGIRSGLVVDLGCGPGHWARRLTRAGYDALGFDISGAMIALARKKAPAARFRVESFARAAIPTCVAVTALGEVFNYTFENDGPPMAELFRRVFRALQPGGLFVFDVAGPDRAPSVPVRNWRESEDWAVLTESTAGSGRRMLTRHIVCFRRVGARYRRSEETHRIRLYDTPAVLTALERAGFDARAMDGYGRTAMIPGVTAFVERKPG
jgi:SAM-dependent methyltransferase